MKRVWVFLLAAAPLGAWWAVVLGNVHPKCFFSIGLKGSLILLPILVAYGWVLRRVQMGSFPTARIWGWRDHTGRWRGFPDISRSEHPVAYPGHIKKGPARFSPWTGLGRGRTEV